MKIAILITCYNRRVKTLACLNALYRNVLPENCSFEIYLVDDNSNDNTGQVVRKEFPLVNLIEGNGNLFWTGGMRKAWQVAIDSGVLYDFFLLLNDDTILFETTINDLINDYIKLNEKLFILIGTTIDPKTGQISYGGRFLLNNYNLKSNILIPNNVNPQLCHLGNANVMLVPRIVYNKIGLLSDLYSHGIADYDYTLRGRKQGIKSYIGSKMSGTCTDEHAPTWRINMRLKERIEFLYSIKGLSYKEYLKFIGLYFPLFLPQAWLLLWLKTFFPQLWNRFKNQAQ